TGSSRWLLLRPALPVPRRPPALAPVARSIIEAQSLDSEARLGWIGARRSRRARSVRRAWPQSPPKLPRQILHRAPSGPSFLSELNETFFSRSASRIEL